MTIRWTRSATRHWEESFQYIENENPHAARRIAQRIVDAIMMLAMHPYAGRAGKATGTREFVVPKSPFIVVYGVDQRADVLSIYAVYDGRRRWPKSFSRE